MLRQGDTGDWVGTFEGHKGAVWGVALNSDATLAASGAADFSGKVWNAVSGEEKVSFQHKHIVKTVSFDRPCERLVTGSNEKLIRVFSLQQPTADPELFTGHTGSIKRAIFFRNDRCILSCGEDKTMRVFDRSTGREVQCIDFTTTPNSLELSPDQGTLTVAHGNSVSFFDADTLAWQKEVKVPTKVAAASLHPDKHTFVCGGEDFKLYKFDYVTGNEIGELKCIPMAGTAGKCRFLSLSSCLQNRTRATLDPCTRSVSVRTASCMPVDRRTEHCASGRPQLARHTDCSSAWTRLRK